MNDRIAYSYRVLELNPGASPDQIKRAYRELVKVWHPDRFPANDPLQSRAHEKLKEINNAYEILTSLDSAGSSQETPKANVIRVSRFIFYGSCFDEALAGDSMCKSRRASEAMTSAFFDVIAEWMAKDRWVKCQLDDALPRQFGEERISHSDFAQRLVILNRSLKITLQSLMMPLVTIYIRDKLSGFPQSQGDQEPFLRALKCAGWDGVARLEGESYLRAESRLCTVGAEDLLDRLFKEGASSWGADTKALFRVRWKNGPNNLEDCARIIGFGIKEAPAYR